MPGYPGVQGPPGPQGAAGDHGADGPQGEVGQRGQPGNAGVPGSRGRPVSGLHTYHLGVNLRYEVMTISYQTLVEAIFSSQGVIPCLWQKFCLTFTIVCG